MEADLWRLHKLYDCGRLTTDQYAAALQDVVARYGPEFKK
jgi:hypothetical protein